MPSRTAAELKDWIKEHRITEVECVVPDMAGIPRGKILPAAKFLSSIDSQTLRLPDSVFGQMVTGDHAETESTTYQSPDMVLMPEEMGSQIMVCVSRAKTPELVLDL